MVLRRFDLRRDIGRTHEEVRRISRAFALGRYLYVSEEDDVYDISFGCCLGKVERIVSPQGLNVAKIN